MDMRIGKIQLSSPQRLLSSVVLTPAMATYVDMLDSDYGCKKALLKMGFETQISFMHNVNKALYTTMS